LASAIVVAGAGVELAALVEPLGAMLPGDIAGFGEFSGDCGAPVGATPLAAAVALEPPVVPKVPDEVAAWTPPALLPDPILPGDAAGLLDSTGALVAPVGAGEVDCAAAMPVVMMIAAEASQMERIGNLLSL